MDADTKLRKCHIKLMRHPETCLYSGVILMGKTQIVDDVPTACTNGVDSFYGRKFIDELTEPEVCGVALHENLHKALRHLMRYRKLMKEDPMLTNAAMDYVVNAVIMSLKDKTLCALPKGGLYDPRFHNWSVLEVYDYLKTGRPQQQSPSGTGKGKPGQPGQGAPLPQGKPKPGKDKVTIGGEDFSTKGHDQHDSGPTSEMSADDMKALEKQVNEAMQQGGILAGRMGAKVPRVIKDALVDPIDWAAEMRDFVQTSTSGKTEYCYRKYNRRYLADDIYLPSTEDETVGEVLFGIDTSGSITGAILSSFASRVHEVCEIVKPEKVRILWWDTAVHGEQVFTGDFSNIRKLLKPQGGGGTHAACVKHYIRNKKINADCLVMFTDGYTEQPVDWTNMTIPTLWLVTENKQFQAPPGNRKVKIDRTLI